MIVVVGGLIEDRGAAVGGPLAEAKILITRRPPGADLAALWEFPGGKVEAREGPVEALIRELREELGVTVAVDDVYAVGHDIHEHKGREVALLIYRCRLQEGEPQPLEAEEMRWVSAEALLTHRFPPADQPALRRLAREIYSDDRPLKVPLAHLGQTRALGALIGQAAAPGDVIALEGTLGAGKTSLTQGIAQGMGVPPEIYVNSPTFTLIQSYEGAECPLHHMDFYRLGDPDEAMGLGLEDYLSGEGVVAMEWPERLGEPLPSGTLKVWLESVGEARVATLSGQGRARDIIAAVAAAQASVFDAAEAGE